jgi:hypothetical protein
MQKYSYDFQLVPADPNQPEAQLSFNEISSAWSPMPDPLPEIRKDRLIDELDAIHLRQRMMVTLDGEMVRDEGGGLLIEITREQVAVHAPDWYFRYDFVDMMHELFGVLRLLASVGHYRIYDEQLERVVDVAEAEDQGEIAAEYGRWFGGERPQPTTDR